MLWCRRAIGVPVRVRVHGPVGVRARVAVGMSDTVTGGSMRIGGVL